MSTTPVRVRPADARSGATFERFTDGGRRWFRKRLRPEHDWITRITGDRDVRTAKIWRAGVMRRAAAVVDHAVVDVSVVDGELAILMRDVGDRLVPEGDGVLDPVTHRGLLDGIAALGTEFRGRRDELGLVPMRDRVRFFARDNIAAELARPDTDPVLRMAYPGAGPFTWDLAWYLALNAARLPEPKEDGFLAGLDRRGVATAGWFDRQLALTLLGGARRGGAGMAVGSPCRSPGAGRGSGVWIRPGRPTAGTSSSTGGGGGPPTRNCPLISAMRCSTTSARPGRRCGRRSDQATTLRCAMPGPGSTRPNAVWASAGSRGGSWTSPSAVVDGPLRSTTSTAGSQGRAEHRAAPGRRQRPACRLSVPRTASTRKTRANPLTSRSAESCRNAAAANTTGIATVGHGHIARQE